MLILQAEHTFPPGIYVFKIKWEITFLGQKSHVSSYSEQTIIVLLKKGTLNLSSHTQ